MKKLNIVNGKCKLTSEELISEVNNFLKTSSLPPVSLWSYGVDNCRVGLKFKGIDEKILTNLKMQVVNKQSAFALLSEFFELFEENEEDNYLLRRVERTLDVYYSKGYSFDDPHKFLCEVLLKMTGLNVHKVMLEDQDSGILKLFVKDASVEPVAAENNIGYATESENMVSGLEPLDTSTKEENPVGAAEVTEVKNSTPKETPEEESPTLSEPKRDAAKKATPIKDNDDDFDGKSEKVEFEKKTTEEVKTEVVVEKKKKEEKKPSLKIEDEVTEDDLDDLLDIEE